jgi:hypothetical protein
MIARSYRERTPARTGAAAVEFAFVAMAFFMLFFGIFEYARYIFFQNVLNAAAREAARFAVVSSAVGTSTYNNGSVTPTQMTAVIQQYADQVLVGTGQNNLVGYPASPAPLPSISVGTFDNFIQVYRIDPVTGANMTDWYNAMPANLVGVSFATPTYGKLNYQPISPAMFFLPSNLPMGATCVMFFEATN